MQNAAPVCLLVHLNVISIELLQETTGRDRLSGLREIGEHQYEKKRYCIQQFDSIP
jgi:hypothetical protein